MPWPSKAAGLDLVEGLGIQWRIRIPKDELIQAWSMSRAGRYDDLGMTCARPLSSWPSGTAFNRGINTLIGFTMAATTCFYYGT